MKKNIAMRVAAFLFILTMISTCAFATTFAKYTSGDVSDDTARVAKWGVGVEITAEDTLFKNSYGPTGKEVVVSSTSDKVVAPGTSGELIIAITGKPEVAVKVSYGVTLTLTGWTINNNGVEEFYCPLVFTVNGHEIDASKYTELDKLITDIQTYIDGGSYEVKPNIDLAKTVTISWIWNFNEGVAAEQTNAKDTLLGNVANGTTPSIQLESNCTVEQINTLS